MYAIRSYYEQVLDDIADGKKESLPYLKKFFNGKEGLESQIESGLDKIDAREISSIRFVITSYSIHYTKLYEQSGRKFRIGGMSGCNPSRTF